MTVDVSELLKIDEKKVLEDLENYLNKLKASRPCEGFLFGLSGGIDSALLGAITVHIFGSSMVQAAYLYDRDSGQQLRQNAKRMAMHLEIPLQAINIGDEMHERKIYGSAHMRVTFLNGVLNRLLHNAYRGIMGETPFISSLRIGAGELGSNDLRVRIYESTCGKPEAAFNIRHIYRREYVEKIAQSEGLILLGAANRTEWLTGWFVSGGIDDLPFQPLMGLYKTQVRQLAAFLGVPKPVISQPPSPDMMKGITDEFGLGMSYGRIDLALDCIERNLDDETSLSFGLSLRELNLVREMRRLSEWKRGSLPREYPVDGGLDGGYRIVTRRGDYSRSETQ
jgi:NAD+ synthase